ncbi:hypothetical protein DSM106972_023710 [Dulcicalothrix desertica PCC 7102]|uniref:Filamentous haemagglutinin FhaB/tRNA nuclease CdiA-like TPS domain-containing protein n=1 Tax=Dulcicalothrix desertica PCC 7102 TaxID=232991 RepID=A0A3S1AQT2_9CYAN|nr:filamentous hemagglutinin N-terminal domain-containing protein [Dulcicalothrix desertica]RUT07110.1 hypothetical protein DSM106972_023710 [Dulcicalothrix desertica PCC 7102]TWH61894.1 filamentous hemagglutinin family protein [Dulcicalothrix desertica PCC 7102]
MKPSYISTYFLGLLLLLPGVGSAQILPDRTTKTQIIPDTLMNGDIINGGLISGGNLFHSFSEFNVNAGRAVYFANPNNITNIFTRITGNNSSSINDTLGVLGNANLFLMNPNGIVFGTNAKLDIKGSFLGTTADTINFADGSMFTTATNSTQSTPLITQSVPIGLGFGSQQASITVNGKGHNLTTDTRLPAGNAPTVRTLNQGLRVSPGKTLALVGGNVNLDGGVLTAETGRIEIGGVGSGQVKITPTDSGFALDYASTSNFGDIFLKNQSLVDVSGVNAGQLQIQGRRINLSDASVVLSQNLGNNNASDMKIHASEAIELSGTNRNGRVRTGFHSETLARGRSSNIDVKTPLLLQQQGAGIVNSSFNVGTTGEINVNANDIRLIGASATNPAIATALTTATYGTGVAGNIKVNAQKILMLGGSFLSSNTYSRSSLGMGGNVIVNADDIQVSGATPLASTTAIASASFGAAKAGNLTVNTKTLQLLESASVSATAFASGDAGNVNINAANSIKVIGSNQALGNSTINSSVTIAPLEFQRILGISGNPTANAGTVLIKTPQLTITNLGAVSVRNAGQGNGGELQIIANSIQFKKGGKIQSRSQNGFGGNIYVQANEMQLQKNSLISAAAGGTGQGGNINLNTDSIVLLENSNITANAIRGQGGRININTQGIFSSPNSEITASSEVGIDGVVQIITPDIKQENNLQQQPSNFVIQETIVANSCLVNRNAQTSQFVVTGNGGVPEAPDTPNIEYSLLQVMPTSASVNAQSIVPESSKLSSWKAGDRIEEAIQLVRTKDGRLLLASSNHHNYKDLKQLTC